MRPIVETQVLPEIVACKWPAMTKPSVTMVRSFAYPLVWRVVPVFHDSLPLAPSTLTKEVLTPTSAITSLLLSILKALTDPG